jgi:hypothetical protein
MGFDPESLPRAIEVIRRFQAEMTALSLQTRKRRVYQFAVQLHPIDRD